jgi:hypothetical protein
MTDPTHDDLGTLLIETFTSREHLADPERAVAIARSSAAATRRSRGPLLLAAAAAVALVASGTTYALSRGGGQGSNETDGPHLGGQNLPMIRTNADNRAQAVREAKRILRAVPDYPGAQPSSAAELPELRQLPTSTGVPHYTVTTSRWWVAGGTSPRAVARWYAAHPARGFMSEGPPGYSSGTSAPTIYFVEFRRRGPELITPTGASIVVDSTRTAHGVGIRATVEVVWPPARPAASYVSGATSIDVQVTTTHLNPGPRSSTQHYTITDPRRITAIEDVFNGLQGSPPFVINCPAITNTVVHRVTFHSPSGDLTATGGGSCGDGLTISRDGHTIEPALAGLNRLVQALGH